MWLVSIGAGSARAGLFALDEAVLATPSRDITLCREAGNIAEPPSRAIRPTWSADAT